MGVFENLKIWIETNSTFIQAISAFVSVIIVFITLIVTVIYVRATFRLVHIPHKSILKPISIINGKNSNFFLKIYNYGPGLAMDVKVRAFVNKSIHRESNPKDIFFYKEIYTPGGNTEIQNEKDESYPFPFLLSFKDPFIIEWRSITGKSYKSVWLKTDTKYDIFFKQNIIGQLICLCKVLFIYLKLPFVKSTKKRYFELYYVKVKILGLLAKEASVTYDQIADKTQKNDEEVQTILNDMKTKGLVEYDGEIAKISEKGRVFLDKNNKV